MSLTADTLLERARLKAQVLRWRLFTFVLVAAVLLSLSVDVKEMVGGSYVARIHVGGLIQEDTYRSEVLKNIAENGNIRAVIVHVNSPGGTVVGGEQLYNELRLLKAEKPVVVVMGTLATSAAYMSAVAADHVLANRGTLTGSIGVIFQAPQVLDMIDKLGIEMNVIKSSPLKAAPSPFEVMSPEAKQMMERVIDDYHNFFIDLVDEARPLNREQVVAVADGRVFTGAQALKARLVDAIGDEKAALAWLKEQRDIDVGDDVRDVEIVPVEEGFSGVLGSIFPGFSYFSEQRKLQGLLSVWNDGMML